MEFKKSTDELIESDELLQAKELVKQEEAKNYESAAKEFSEFMIYFEKKYKITLGVQQPQIQLVKIQ